MNIKPVFKNLKIVDFSWYAAGPYVAQYLAGYGATVIRVESSRRIDGMRSTGPFKDEKPGVNRGYCFPIYNSNKYGITLNLKHEQKMKVVRKLAAWADVVLENFTPGTIDKMGLGYQELKKIKPDIIMLSTSNQGQTGPNRSAPGFGSHLIALAGFVNLTGWPDRSPVMTWGAYTDFIAARYATIALLAALSHHNRTGEGAYIDISQYECSVPFLSPLLLQYSCNGTLAERNSNRCDYAAPHGVYPCRDDDTWCSIAVFHDDDWNKLCGVMGVQSLARDAKFATLRQRKANEDDLDKLVGSWTRDYTPDEVMTRLQNAGIDAGALRTPKDITDDPQLRHQNHFVEMEHPEIGRHLYEAPASSLSETPGVVDMPAPCLGQHNYYVYTQLLGMSDDEFLSLGEEGLLD